MPKYRVAVTRTIKQVVYLDIEATDGPSASKACLKHARTGTYDNAGSRHEGNWNANVVKELHDEPGQG